jgi:hypothetical protein
MKIKSCSGGQQIGSRFIHQRSTCSGVLQERIGASNSEFQKCPVLFLLWKAECEAQVEGDGEYAPKYALSRWGFRPALKKIFLFNFFLNLVISGFPEKFHL